ncbi:methylaspartate mutase [Streptomyces sp. NBC_00328]|uniref:methylaspartate mutase n=1 Tax=Streptomyces sp. NBC_00328 TaxID=2903646 RepID=UPI002E27DE48|nr:methylaspartate mutase [Streptomyces sp. NBC_00328]
MTHGLPLPGLGAAALQAPPDFGAFVRHRGARDRLVVQPRMGFGDPAGMRRGLLATKRAAATTVGTLTLDSYTRVGDLAAVRTALREGTDLNGYPLVSHPVATTAALLGGVRDDGFPVQVRHGSAVPIDIFRALIRLGLNATEGGPVSYCLPYGRTPLDESVRNWRQCCEMYSRLRETGVEPHLETFGGCMLGQLCPPSQLVAISLLEALFFAQHGIRSLSLSYAQQTDIGQDHEAVLALRRLCAELLPTPNWHIVVYAYMGVYPQTPQGARRLLGQAAALAVTSGAPRLIVKTVAEAHRIPTIAENVQALEHAGAVARAVALDAAAGHEPAESQVYTEARALVDTVLDLHDDVGAALLAAFRRGLLDIPYCVHPDNAGRARSRIDTDGRLRWSELGNLPLRGIAERATARRTGSAELLEDLFHLRSVYDDPTHPRSAELALNEGPG